MNGFNSCLFSAAFLTLLLSSTDTSRATRVQYFNTSIAPLMQATVMTPTTDGWYGSVVGKLWPMIKGKAGGIHSIPWYQKAGITMSLGSWFRPKSQSKPPAAQPQPKSTPAQTPPSESKPSSPITSSTEASQQKMSLSKPPPRAPSPPDTPVAAKMTTPSQPNAVETDPLLVSNRRRTPPEKTFPSSQQSDIELWATYPYQITLQYV